MLQKITKNWNVKVVCICLAAILWIYVSMDESSVAKLPGSIKIKPINIGQDLVAEFDIKTVEIKVSGKSSLWQKISVDSFSANVDVAGLTAGTYQLPVNVISQLAGINVVEKSPDRILVSIEPVISKEFIISKKIQGEPAEGMAIGGVEFTPEKAIAKGAKSVVENMNDVSALIMLNHETDSFSKTFILAGYDLHGDIINELEIVPEKVETNISIVKGAGIKTVGVKPVIIGNPKENYFVQEIKISPSVLDISGTSDGVNAVRNLQTTTIDITGLSDNLEKDVNIVMPDNILLLDGGSTRAHVVISISPAEILKDVTVSNITVKQNDHGTVSINPPAVNVSVKGSPESIGRLRSEDISLTLDLNGREPNSSGEIIFVIQKENFTVPSGVTISSISPTTLIVKAD